MDKLKIVENIQRICKERGTTPTVAGEKSGAGKEMVSNMKQKGTVPSIERFQLFAEYLGVTTSELLGERPPDVPASPEPLTPDEQQLLRDYRELNSQGQEYIRQTMHMAVQTYKKNPDLSKLEGQK